MNGLRFKNQNQAEKYCHLFLTLGREVSDTTERLNNHSLFVAKGKY